MSLGILLLTLSMFVPWQWQMTVLSVFAGVELAFEIGGLIFLAVDP